MRMIYYLLLASCGVAGAANVVMTISLAYATEPVEFTWATDTAPDSTASGFLEVADPSTLRAACEPIILDAPPISYRTVADFATEAVLAVNTFDYLDWDNQLPEALNRYFAPNASRLYLGQFERSALLRTIQSNYYTVSALSLRPGIVVSESDIPGRRQWTVQVPIRIYYQTGAVAVAGATTDETQDQVFTVTVIELPPTPRNYRGVGVESIANTRVREVDDLDRLR